VQRDRGHYESYYFPGKVGPLCLRDFLGKLFQAVVVVGIKAVSAFSIHMAMMRISHVCLGSDVYTLPEGYLCILQLV